MKKLIAILMCVTFAALVGKMIGDNMVLSASQRAPKDNNYEILPTQEIPAEYEKDNLYVKLNNLLIKAMNDYEAGRINQREYEKICGDICDRIDKQEEYEKFVDDEQEFHNEIIE